MVDQGIYVIIDGSGSMSGVKNDVVQGINEFIKEQQADVKGTNDVVQFSLTTFDSNVMEVYVKETLELVKPLTVKDTFLGGGTALLDAVGRTLTNAEEDGAARNLVVIYTDGQENQSREFTRDDIEKLIQKLNDAGNWQFIYLGAEFADFQNEAAFASMAAAGAGKFSSFNTSKANVGGTWATVTQTANYHRNATESQYSTLRSGERDIAAAATQDAGVDWDSVKEDDETTS